jgi:uncharacterized repeat protein (TIGR01451 family)
MLTKLPSPPHALLSLTAKQKLVLTLLVTVLFSIPVWLGLEPVHSAPAEVASPPPAPMPPTVTLIDVPNEVLIGEEFTFKVKFESPAGSPFGYGPFIDLVLDAGGANIAKPPQTPACPCDGITFVKAKLLDVIGGPTDLTPPPSSQILTSPCGSVSNNNVQHPFGSFANSGIQPLTLPPGAQLITIEFPFGSFTPAQPYVTVEVTAKVSNLADYNFLLKISARGGYRYGGDALNNPSPDHPVFSDEIPLGTQVTNSTQWLAQATVKPNVMTMSKVYKGPEDETATGPNFPHNYDITVDIANGQSVANLVVTDVLPNNMQYISLVSVSIHGTPATLGIQYSVTPPTGVGGTLTVSFLVPIVGTLAPDDVAISFKFYIPEFDSNLQPILPNCTPALSNNDIKAEGDWTQTPPDSCDQSPTHVVSDVKPIDHQLADKCLAIQKSVAMFNDTGTPGLTPGDTLLYTLTFEVSDYKTIGNLVVTDFLSNGQVLASPVSLSVGDQFGTKTGNIPPFLVTQTTDLMGAAKYCPIPLQQPQGGTVLTFKVSQAMSLLPSFINPRLTAGILTGGYAAGPGLPNGPAGGTIKFRATVLDSFQFPVPTGHDQYVDKDDPFNNCVQIEGKVYANITGPSPVHARNIIPTSALGPAVDTSATHLTIVTDRPEKSVYAVKRGGSFNCGPLALPAPRLCSNYPNPTEDVLPGDEVTFRIEKTIPSSDAEQLIIQDWFPLPIFNISGISFNNAVCGIPGSNSGCLLPTDTLSTWVTPPPSFSANPVTNSIKFDYHDFHDINNQPRTIDIVVTETVTNQPFADGLFLTNVAQECENDTFSNVPHCQTSIAQVKVREPKLQITKGVVATDNPHGVFTPALNPTGVWQPYGSSCPDFQNGPITSATLGGLINSNLSNVDANDHVTFGIAIENTGGAPACEIELADIIPLDPLDKPSCFDPDYSSLCITDGNGTPIPFTTAIGGHGRKIIKLAPGFCLAPGSPANTAGTNIAIITFNAQLHSDITPGCCDNVAQLLHYTSQQGGPNFVDAGLTPPFSDAATVCVNPTLTKSLVATSELHTAGSDVIIGEVARYRLAVVVPEGGVLPNFQVIDALPPGMKFLNDGSARLAFISNLSGITHPFPPVSSTAFNVNGNELTLPGLTFNPSQTVPATAIIGGVGCGAPVTFNLGNIQNNDNNDPDLELIVIEFNALVCNVASNQSGITLPNTFSVSVAGNQIATSNQINVLVVEPNLTMTKTVAPNPALSGQTLTYTVQYTNNGTADAFDVVLQDTLPAGLTLGTVTAGCPVTTTSNVITVTCAQVPKAPNPGSTVIVTYQAVANPATCPVTLNNQATLTWTSLPGPQGTTVNPTGSSTPGNSGLIDGERNGVTPLLTLNDYATTASAAVKIDCPCCLQVSNEMLACNSGGSFNYTFTLTNLSGATVAGVNFSPSAGVTITPSSLAIPPLANGASTNVTVTIGGPAAVSGATVCFGVGIGGPAAPSCRVQHCVTLPACQASACATPPPSMVSWWPLDETSGNTVVDIAGGHNGTMSANIGSDPLSAMPPKVGNALLFVNSKATVAGGPYNFGTGNFSIDAWVRGPISNAALGIVDKLDMSNPIPTGFAFFIRSGSVRLVMGNGTTGPATFMSPATFTYGTWQHVAVTVQRVGVGSPIGRFYLNGALVSTFVPPLTSVNNGASLLLGSHRLNVGCGSCEVSLDEVEIFNDVVPASDINSIFQADKNGKCKLPDLTIQKKVQCSPPPTKCQIFLTIGNNGPSSFNGILTVQDLVTPPPSLGLSWAGSSTPPGWSCSIGPSDTISCASNSSVPLPPGQSTTFSVSVNVPVGHFKNCASVKGYTQFPFNSTTLIQEANSNNNQGCVPMP